MAGLLIVATPIGNLRDITLRALDELAAADLILCEDKRTSSVLLKEYNIEKPLLSFHQHNEHRQVDKVMEYLKGGKTVALISDAGMPGISDPGFLAVRAAHHNAIPVTVIPGASAAVSALVASGLPCERYVYEGFLPHKKGRKTRLETIAGEHRTVVLYESPHRIGKLADQLLEHMHPERLVVVIRELTKHYEEVIRKPLGQLKQELDRRQALKGEIVVVIAGKDYSE